MEFFVNLLVKMRDIFKTVLSFITADFNDIKAGF